MSYADGTVVPGLARPMDYLPNTGGWTGRWRPVRNHHNDYLIDRESQRRGESYSGLVGIPLQDQMVQEGMGPIVDRTMEHLGASDRMVMITRKALLDALRDRREKGVLPRVLTEPELARRATGGDMLVTTGVDWVDAYEEAMTKKYGPQAQAAAE
jgi:hypothetical protein